MDNEKKWLKFEAIAKKLISEDNWYELFRIANEVIELYPEYAAGYVYRGIAKGNSGDFQGAIKDCAIAINIDPKSDFAYISRGVTKGNLGDFQGAINDYTEALKINAYEDYYVDRGVALAELGDRKGAIEDFDKALKLNPNHIQAIHNKGVAQAIEASEKQREETIKQLDEEYKKQIAASQKKQEETIKKFNEEYKKQIANYEQQIAASQKKQDETIKELNENYEEQLENREKELLDAYHYRNEKEKYEWRSSYYNKIKNVTMFFFTSFVLAVAYMLVVYLKYLISSIGNGWTFLLFFSGLAIASLSLFPFIWIIRNINHDRNRCWALSEDMHTKWILLTLSVRYPGISEEIRNKLPLQFFEHLSNSNTPNIILSKDVGDKSDFNSMVKNFIHQKNKE